jgi:hypothetical protein
MSMSGRIRLGVLGADDSLSVIRDVAKEFGELELIPVVYWEEDEIPDRISPYLADAHMWLCSGQVPYVILYQQLKVDRPVFYTRHSGEGLYKALLYWVHERGVRISEMSFDTLSPETLQKFLMDVGIESTFYVKHYTGSIRSEELVQYHKSLWERGLIKVAVTCLRSAQLQLKQLGIPCTHITPTHSEVRQALESIVQTQALLVSRDAQVAVQLIQRADGDEVRTSEADFDSAIHRYSRYVHGTTQKVSANQWMIYATRGAIEELTDHFQRRPPLHAIADLEDHLITAGIGIGKTVRDAQERARLALEQANLCGSGSWACALENDTLITPLGVKDFSLSYQYVREDMQELGREVPLSTLTLTKIAGVLAKRGSTRITAHELAQYLHILPRSARRILLTLEAHGMATVVGEDTSHQRGRPRKIYDIRMSGAGNAQ